MTQTALGVESKLPQTLISRLENSDIGVLEEGQLEAIEVALRLPRSWFLPHEEETFKQPLSLHSTAFRKAASSSQKKVDFAVALANHYVIHVRKLLDAVDLEHQWDLPAFEIVDPESGKIAENATSVGSPEEAARRIRQFWQLPTGAINNLTRLVEACGIIVISADFDDVDVDGVTIRPTGLRPIIFLNRNRPACRKRFSLAHELGHAVLHGYNTPNMEIEANRFAAELLMPRADILADFRRKLSIPQLGKLKLKWRCSMASILYRAKEIRALTDHQARSLWISMSKAGYRIREPEVFDIEEEKPSTYRSLIALHQDELGYSISDIAHHLETHLDEFLHMAGLIPEPSLRPKAARLRVVVDNSAV